MSGSTPELALKTAVDSDDTADYLTLSLATSLQTVDALFNNVAGHNHSGAHQGGPIAAIPASAIPDGSITSAKIADGTITSADLAPNTASFITARYLAATPAASTTSPAFTTIAGLDVPFSATGGQMVLFAAIPWSVSAPPGVAGFGAQIDSGVDLANFAYSTSLVNANLANFVLSLGAVAAGAHTLHLRWLIQAGGTLSTYGGNSQIILVEFRR
jgi:hypothetical protein